MNRETHTFLILMKMAFEQDPTLTVDELTDKCKKMLPWALKDTWSPFQGPLEGLQGPNISGIDPIHPDDEIGPYTA